MSPRSYGSLRRGALALAAFAIVSLSPACALAQAGGNPPDTTVAAAPPPEIVVNGFASMSFEHNLNDPVPPNNLYRVFDVDNDAFLVDVVEMVVQMPVSAPGQGGFRADLDVGASIPHVTASRGLFRPLDGAAAWDIDLQQAYVSYIAPLGSGLRIDLGKFITFAGAEVIEGHDGYNDNATRSVLFGYAIPFTHTGLRLGYTAGSAFSATAMLVNGWDVVIDNNKAMSFGAQATLTPVDDLSLLVGYIGGAERDSNTSDMRHLVDVVGTWHAGKQWTFVVNGDYGVDQNAVAAGRDATWKGLAAYAKFKMSDLFSLALRGEVFDDPDGFRTGVGQTLRTLTLTPEFHPAEHVALRFDFRVDVSDHDVFNENGTPTGSQPTVLLNGLFAF